MVTSSEEFYPTVALNALVRALRDPALASQQAGVVSSLASILRGLGMAAVGFLPKVLPVLLNMGLMEGDLRHLVSMMIHVVMSGWPAPRDWQGGSGRVELTACVKSCEWL
jgi:hypothetical protein